MSPLDSQEFESFVPVYDTIPEEWKEAREFFVEQLKKISNAVNIREIGWFLDQELLSGKQFLPPTGISGSSEQYRAIFRMVVNVSPLVVGVNTFPHGILFDANFTLIDLWVSGTNSTTLTALTITGNNVVMNATNLVITSPQAFDRAFAVIEYTLEV